MSIVRFENLKPGMILADNLQNLDGRVLLKAGAQLDQENLKTLEAWGVTEANIQDGLDENIEPPVEPGIDPEQLAQAEAETMKIFRHANVEQPPMKEIVRLSALYFLKNKT
ncbi:hypothetical protein UR09_04310 [Candidatus Nitromaritima sp. SCGC AAA799-A02]|nr:hypothetical protein UR09_04310 [Candidatus Nitromaritima sp. SCGC AAA799-A02]KMP11588.1 hypothetical protein UZ36_03820 [Candidatus Nitromaritima sp. SCGC AAA799-C22]